MAVPETDAARILRWCEDRVPPEVRHERRLDPEMGPRHVTIVDARVPEASAIGPGWSRRPVARLAYDPGSGEWTLLSVDPGGAFTSYDTPPTQDVGDLLAELDADPHATFWS